MSGEGYGKVANFVVNLDRDADRLEKSEKLFASAGLTFERVRGVDARQMSADELRAACPRFRFYLANARRVRPGEIGCALSHRKCWEEVARRNIPLAAIYEDDVLFDAEKLKASLASIAESDDPSVPTVWLMNRGLPRPRGETPGPWYDMRSTNDVARVWSMFCYAVNTAAARRLAEILTPMTNVADSWPTYARCGVRVMISSDPCATTCEGPSTIGRKRSRMWEVALFRNFYWMRYRIAFRLDLLLKRLEGKR